MKLRVLPGDGVGGEATEAALRVLDWFMRHRGLAAEVTRRD